MLVDKIPQKTKIDSKKQKVHKGVAILTEGEGLWGLAQCKSNCEEHVGSDKSFESVSLFIEQLLLEIQFTKERKHWKRAVWNKLASTKIWAYNPILWSAVALNVNYKAKFKFKKVTQNYEYSRGNLAS